MSNQYLTSNDFRSKMWRRKIEVRNRFAERANELSLEDREVLSKEYNKLFDTDKKRKVELYL